MCVLQAQLVSLELKACEALVEPLACQDPQGYLVQKELPGPRDLVGIQASVEYKVSLVLQAQWVESDLEARLDSQVRWV